MVGTSAHPVAVISCGTNIWRVTTVIDSFCTYVCMRLSYMYVCILLPFELIDKCILFT